MFKYMYFCHISVYKLDLCICISIQEDFEEVSLIHIPWIKNGRAVLLAKEAKKTGTLFFHID